MNTWTLLLVTVLGGPMDGERGGLLYPSMAACLAAHHVISDGLGYNHQIRCEDTGILSSSMRPRPRPARSQP